MTPAKYKICPACGEQNPPTLLECRVCETDLTGVKITDGRADIQEQETERVSAGSSPGNGAPALVRICECGAQNPPQARKCGVCGEDISDIIPVPSVTEESAFSYQLQAVGDDYSVTIDDPVTVIGREAALKDYLGGRMYVSRQHARLTIADGAVKIENLSRTNRTFVNNKAVSGSESVVLADGDEIGLGGLEIGGKRQEQAAYFVFRARS